MTQNFVVDIRMNEHTNRKKKIYIPVDIKSSKSSIFFRRSLQRQCLCYILRLSTILNIRLSTILKILSYHSFKAVNPTPSRLHHRLPKSFNADTISPLHLLKSIWEGNMCLGPLETILRILESRMICKFPVTT